MADCQLVDKYLKDSLSNITALDKIPSTYDETNCLLWEHEQQVRSVFDAPQLLLLQEEGDTILNQLQLEESFLGHSPDYKWVQSFFLFQLNFFCFLKGSNLWSCPAWIQGVVFVLPSTRQDLTQGYFIVGVGDGDVAQELRLIRCWTMLVIGSQDAMWTMLAFAKSPGMYAKWPCWS